MENLFYKTITASETRSIIERCQQCGYSVIHAVELPVEKWEQNNRMWARAAKLFPRRYLVEHVLVPEFPGMRGEMTDETAEMIARADLGDTGSDL